MSSQAVQLPAGIVRLVQEHFPGHTVDGTQEVQRLWNDYGCIVRIDLQGPSETSLIAKWVQWPTERSHPRGWQSDRSHARKVDSYRVEACWYERFASSLGPSCRVAKLVAVEERNDGVVLLLEDLDRAGFAGRYSELTRMQIEACLRWLGGFHAALLGKEPDGLWPVGTYWHLATRPDELSAMPDDLLKQSAGRLDEELNSARFKTLVHGDAKVANFCFAEGTRDVAAVDFQYVGAGVGVKDVAYFVSSCLDEREAEELEEWLLDRYFEALRAAIAQRETRVDLAALEAEWRNLYPVAYADFYRFLAGWSPGHWKMNAYARRLTERALRKLASTR